MKAHLLFEQSGTFKRAFKELGIEAEDYDILNDFGETDHQVDLFDQINRGYEGQESIFDNFGDEDIVLAFFPCTRFEVQILMGFRGELYQFANWTDEQKLEYAIKLHGELHELYVLICKLFVIAKRGGWKMVVENPYAQQHYLVRYFPVKAKVIDLDRTQDGDYYKKPTQYWFINCEPQENLVFEPLEYVKRRNIEQEEGGGKKRQVARSMIHPQYARRFIRRYIL